MHHIIADGWSIGVAAGELASLYLAFQQNKPSPLPELAIQYVDYVDWQRRTLSGAGWLDRLEALKRRLVNIPCLNLPTDHPRPPARTSRGAVHAFPLDEHLSEAVRELGRRESATPFMVFLAAFQMTLGKWSGQDDFAIGTPAANRTRAETENMIGYFVNMLVIRADLSGDPALHDLIARVRSVAIEAYENQDVPLELLIRRLQPQRDVSRSPLFQVMFAMQNNRLPQVGELGLTLEPVDVEGGTGTSKFDLSLSLTDGPSGFSAALEYSTDLFSAPTVQQFAAHFERILRQMVVSPGLRLSSLMLADDHDRTAVLEWSRQPQRPQAALTIHEAFEEQARRVPDATALVTSDSPCCAIPCSPCSGRSGGRLPTRWPWWRSAMAATGPTTPSASGSAASSGRV